MSDQTEIVIASGARTPIGAFSGSFATLPAHALGAAAITAALSRASVGASDVSEVILGQVLTAGAGMNPCPPGRHGRRCAAGADSSRD